MNKKKILVVEDDADVRLGYQVLLEAHQYEPSFADDLASAVIAQAKHEPDLIILDLGLPGPDGFLVMDRFDLLMFLVPVIVVSAREPRGNKERALKAGAKAYVQKPWNDEELLATISQLLAESETLGQPVAVV